MHIRLFVLWIGVMLTMIAPDVQAEAAGGRLVAVSGGVWTRAPGDTEMIARPGSVLAPGTRIRTGADGKAEVVFVDGSSVLVRSNTAMVLSGIKRQEKKKTALLIFFGRIWNKVTRSAGDQTRYAVHTPLVVCGVRGTVFETAVGADGSVRVMVEQGSVGVNDQGQGQVLQPGQEVEVDVDRIGMVSESREAVDWGQWQEQKRDHLRRQGPKIINDMNRRLNSRKEQVTILRQRQNEIVQKRKAAELRYKNGDDASLDQIRQYNAELISAADQIADQGDAAASQFGLVDHLGERAADPLFEMADGPYVAAEAERLKRIKADFDQMIAEGTDLSIEAMETMLEEMSRGRRGSLKFKKGSSADDLWGE